ncbi:tRNA (adenosine(37)-N6)-dimethylallyltransferase MiaA [Limibaculum sp. FT325]|uniref:tRNA (adenosine(37)-N6)-dimethylallyltransferase MiaA n=1 Tax=Thermohalobaculum sediminis TaxID=2939436 RepID=UPI0020BE55BF|nr:tRNA (adenosine(37)-N6)-dimethylallyltransferase MiaA [Limibaculum sediminis]MCL5775860.1 tRNA (adenosine(37)-N6)-dimethylallyltransferase MiaA [Limibaculum sediminis]
MTAAPVLVAGPTASGKSSLALALAGALGGVVINADSQQVYGGWRILTARPSQPEEARAPHRLYGHVPLGAPYSVGEWLRDLGPVLAEARAAGLRPIIVGGTGLYFRALTAGLAVIPPIPAAVRARGEAALERDGLGAFAAALAARDAATAARIDLANPARVLRAWEVLEATGRPLAAWQDDTPAPLLPLAGTVPLALLPPREVLAARCDARLDAMLAEGVLDEVRAVMALGLAPDAPGMKAVGAPEFMAHLRGETTLDTALAAAKLATRRYAKRQLTWIRGQMEGWTVLETPEPYRALARVAEADAQARVTG